MKVILVAGLSVLLLTGCGVTKLDPMVADKIETSRAQQREACEARKTAQAEADMKMAAGLSKEAQMEFVRSIGTSRIVASATGNLDACGNGGTNAYDVQVAEVKEKNLTVRELGGDIVQGTVIVTGISAAKKVLTKALDSAGDNTQNNITGDGNEQKSNHTQTTSNAETHASADGEGSSTSVGHGDTTGPDQSAPTTTTNTGIVPEGSTLAGAEAEPVAEHVGSK